MSWPADGKPRFIVSEVAGHLAPGYNQRLPFHEVSAVVLDRAYCHRIVAQYRSEDGRGPRAERIEAVRRRARGHAYMLNHGKV